MALHIDFGKKGEGLAAGWLIRKGFEILHQNWRHSRYEVDIIARYQGVIHFIVVKAGQSNAYGQPEEKVSKSKIRNMMKGAAACLYQFAGHKMVQDDVLVFTFCGDAEPEYFPF